MKLQAEYEQYIFVIRQLVKREMKRKYSRSYLGVVWSVLNPLLSMIIMSVIFSLMFQKSIENYPIYLLTGTMMWSYFTTATIGAMTALVDNKMMLMKVKFPMDVFVYARVYSGFANLCYTFVAYLFILLVFQVAFDKKMILAPIILFFMSLFNLGMGYILSAAYVFFGDIKHLYTVLLQLWMYCSAIFYPVESVPAFMQTIIKLNPVYNYICCMRKAMIYQLVPSVGELVSMVLWGVGMFGIGLFIFKRSKNNIMQTL